MTQKYALILAENNKVVDVSYSPFEVATPEDGGEPYLYWLECPEEVIAGHSLIDDAFVSREEIEKVECLNKDLVELRELAKGRIKGDMLSYISNGYLYNDVIVGLDNESRTSLLGKLKLAELNEISYPITWTGVDSYGATAALEFLDLDSFKSFSVSVAKEYERVVIIYLTSKAEIEQITDKNLLLDYTINFDA
jgi:hypothetical protein